MCRFLGDWQRDMPVGPHARDCGSPDPQDLASNVTTSAVFAANCADLKHVLVTNPVRADCLGLISIKRRLAYRGSRPGRRTKTDLDRIARPTKIRPLLSILLLRRGPDASTPLAPLARGAGLLFCAAVCYWRVARRRCSDGEAPGIFNAVEKTGTTDKKPAASKPRTLSRRLPRRRIWRHPTSQAVWGPTPSPNRTTELLPCDGTPMTIDDVLQYALDHHPVLRKRQHEVEIAQAKLVTAGLLPNPQLTFDTETPTRNAGETQLSGRLMFTIPTGGKRRYGMQAARAGIQRAQMTVSVETEAVLVAASETALEVLYLQLVEVYDRLNDLAAQGAEIQKARFELQAIPYTDKMIAESNAVDIGTRRLDAVAKLERRTSAWGGWSA